MGMKPKFKKVLWIFVSIFVFWCVLIGLRNWYIVTHPIENSPGDGGIHIGLAGDTVELPSKWKYQAGDSKLYSMPDFPIGDWRLVDTRLDLDSIPEGMFEGIGWFRTSF